MPVEAQQAVHLVVPGFHPCVLGLKPRGECSRGSLGEPARNVPQAAQVGAGDLLGHERRGDVAAGRKENAGVGIDRVGVPMSTPSSRQVALFEHRAHFAIVVALVEREERQAAFDERFAGRQLVELAEPVGLILGRLSDVFENLAARAADDQHVSRLGRVGIGVGHD